MNEPFQTHARTRREGESVVHAPYDPGAAADEAIDLPKPRRVGNLCAAIRIAAIGVLVVGGLWGFLMSLGIISEAAGHWGVVVAVALAPITIAAAPVYAGLAWGEWIPMVLNYGGGVASALLLYLGAALAGE